jgi:hypothetical protein
MWFHRVESEIFWLCEHLVNQHKPCGSWLASDSVGTGDIFSLTHRHRWQASSHRVLYLQGYDDAPWIRD